MPDLPTLLYLVITFNFLISSFPDVFISQDKKQGIWILDLCCIMDCSNSEIPHATHILQQQVSAKLDQPNPHQNIGVSPS